MKLPIALENAVSTLVAYGELYTERAMEYILNACPDGNFEMHQGSLEQVRRWGELKAKIFGMLLKAGADRESLGIQDRLTRLKEQGKIKK
jgi:hypothetical protein